MPHRQRLIALLLLTLLIVGGSAPVAVAASQAQNVILFIGDGMGPGHVSMARGAVGRPLAMERTPFSGTATTTSLGGLVTDSAAAATALATGHKTRNGMVSMSPEGQPLETILERCRKKGKATGFITTDALWGATPACFYAHVAKRGQSADIALQAAKSQAQVMLGFERGAFLPTAAGGKRNDGQDLVAGLRSAGYEIVSGRYELLTAQGKRLVGLFEDGPQAPRVRDMVTTALTRVGADPDGFFLVVELSRMDWDPGDPPAVLADALELDEAVAAAVDYAEARGRTLVLVTGDHETGRLEIQHPERLPVLLKISASASEIAARVNKDRSNVSQVMSECTGWTDFTAAELDKIAQAKDVEEAIGDVLSERVGIKWSSKGHTTTPVPVFAFGAGAGKFTGAMDNTDIAKRMAEILGVGPFSETAGVGAAAVAGPSK